MRIELGRVLERRGTQGRARRELDGLAQEGALSAREREVLSLANIRRKLRQRTRAAAVAQATRDGLI